MSESSPIAKIVMIGAGGLHGIGKGAQVGAKGVAAVVGTVFNTVGEIFCEVAKGLNSAAHVIDEPVATTTDTIEVESVEVKT